MQTEEHDVTVKVDSDRMVFQGRKGHLRCGVIEVGIPDMILIFVNFSNIIDTQEDLRCFITSEEFAKMIETKIHEVNAREEEKELASEPDDVQSAG